MSAPTNLRRARKAKARAAKLRDAASQSAREGLTKQERVLRAKQAAAAARRLEGARLEPPDER